MNATHTVLAGRYIVETFWNNLNKQAFPLDTATPRIQITLVCTGYKRSTYHFPILAS
jgi:hypothetical protein